MSATETLAVQGGPDPETRLRKLEEELSHARAELRNLLEINAPLAPQPRQIPRVNGIDIFGESIQLNGMLGGDHIIFVDFSRRYDLEERIRLAEEAGKESVKKRLQSTAKTGGILVADVAGHSVTDAALAGRLHDAFSVCVLYELDIYGTVTERLFETLNISLYHSTSVQKFITMIYGEVSEQGTFKFISAAHPMPIVFSNEFDRIVDISPERFSVFPPLGSQPPEYHIDRRRIRSNPLGYKKKYNINEINLMGQGDILLIYTDGLSEFANENGEHFFATLEGLLKSVKHLPASEIGGEIRKAISVFGKPSDDISYVVVKKS
ncbi:MAG TPA: PP2C family protein-serine/threonine phosphatase [Acidobacteriota bacterium]